MSKVVETDSRGRISLKKLGVQSHSHYQVSMLPSGNVLLEPATFTTRPTPRSKQCCPTSISPSPSTYERTYLTSYDSYRHGGPCSAS